MTETKSNKVLTGVYLSKTMADKLRQFAAATDKTNSEVVEEALNGLLGGQYKAVDVDEVKTQFEHAKTELAKNQLVGEQMKRNVEALESKLGIVERDTNFKKEAFKPALESRMTEIFEILGRYHDMPAAALDKAKLFVQEIDVYYGVKKTAEQLLMESIDYRYSKGKKNRMEVA
jgi:hypothetical protein